MDTSVSITVGSTTLDEDQEDVRFDTLSLQIAQNLSQKLSRAFREVFLLFSPRDPYSSKSFYMLCNVKYNKYIKDLFDA